VRNDANTFTLMKHKHSSVCIKNDY